MQAEGLSKSLASVEWMNASEDPALTCPPHLTNVYSALFFNADCCAVLCCARTHISEYHILFFFPAMCMLNVIKEVMNMII